MDDKRRPSGMFLAEHSEEGEHVRNILKFGWNGRFSSFPSRDESHVCTRCTFCKNIHPPDFLDQLIADFNSYFRQESWHIWYYLILLNCFVIGSVSYSVTVIKLLDLYRQWTRSIEAQRDKFISNSSFPLRKRIPFPRNNSWIFYFPYFALGTYCRVKQTCTVKLLTNFAQF